MLLSERDKTSKQSFKHINIVAYSFITFIKSEATYTYNLTYIQQENCEKFIINTELTQII